MAKIYGIPDSERRLSKSNYKPISLQQGVKGENDVLNKLAELDDNFHVLCDVRIDLGRLVTYPFRKTLDLRKAQMDFVVVSRRGVVLIEAKNWTDKYYSKSIEGGGIIPHEQVDRAGLVLFIKLNPRQNQQKISVIKVLLSTHGNMRYNPDYKMVHVKDLNNINDFIQNQNPQFSDEDVKEMIGRITDYRYYF